MKPLSKIFLLLTGLLLSLTASSQDDPVKWKISTNKISACEYEIVFNGTIEHPWHVYSLNLAGSDGPMPSSIKLKSSPDYEAAGKPTEGKAIKAFDKVFEMEVAYFEKTVTFKQKVRLKNDTRIKVSGTYEYQACTEEKCIFPPATPFEFELQGTADCKKNAATTTSQAGSSGSASPCYCDSVALLKIWKSISGTQPADKAHTNNKTESTANIPQTAEHTTEAAAAPEDDASLEGKPWWMILLTGFAWGFAALFTPCVFPLIPMNVSFFLKRSKTKAKGKINAILYALSIIVIFVSLGLGISAIWGGGALNTFATSAGFNMVIFILLLVFAASFLGAFEIVLPASFVNKIDRQGDRGGYAGIFFMALALVVVSFSCTGPMVGNALVAASTSGNTSGAFWAMLGFSSGLALPFGLFAFFPSMLNSMPKSGGWLNTVKVVLGFLELALALKFASNVDVAYGWGILPREVFIAIWIAIFGLMSLYLMGMFKTAHDSDLKHLSVPRLFFLIASVFVTIYILPGLWGAPLKLFSGVLPSYDNSESPNGFMGSGPAMVGSADDEFGKYMHVSKNGIKHFKNDYDHALAYAKKVGKPLMIDFTGFQCANCRKTEDNIWPDAEVTRRLNEEVVLVSLFVDDKAELDPKEYQKVFWFGQEREITTIGDKFKYMEETLYKQSAQPLYVLLDHQEKTLITPRGYNASISGYIKWLDQGINEFKRRISK